MNCAFVLAIWMGERYPGFAKPSDSVCRVATLLHRLRANFPGNNSRSSLQLTLGPAGGHVCMNLAKSVICTGKVAVIDED